jgi:hypothetical protein
MPLRAPCAARPAKELRIMELLTLNIFAQSLPFAVIGVALFAGLIALPWWPRRRPHDAAATNGQPAFGPVGSLSCPASPGLGPHSSAVKSRFALVPVHPPTSQP